MNSLLRSLPLVALFTFAPVVGCGGTASSPSGAEPEGASGSASSGASSPSAPSDTAGGAPTLACEAGVLSRTPWSTELEALCLGVPDCTAVGDVLVEGCPNTSVCTCGGGHCYGATTTEVDCIGPSETQCGDRLCEVGQTCSITIVASDTAVGGQKSAFACTP